MTFTKETMLSEVLEQAPEAIEVFMGIGMHCMGCAMASGENIEQACMAHGVNPDDFLVTLNKFMMAQ